MLRGPHDANRWGEPRAPRRTRGRHVGWGLALLLALACREPERAPSDHDRAWGALKRAENTEARAAEAISVDQLAESPAPRQRVFGMSFEEVVARMGPVRYRGRASFRIDRNQHDFEVVEKTLIESGNDADVRVVQRGADDRLIRKAIRTGGSWYVRQEAGRLQTADFAQRSMLQVHEEAFAPLSDVTKLFAPALRWRATPSGANVRLELDSQGSAAAIEADGYPPMRLESAAGQVIVRRDTGVAVRADLDLVARFVGSAGRLEVRVERQIEPMKPATFDVADAAEPPARAPVDLRPLDFLDELTRTSTVIGGDEPRAP